MLKNKIIRKVIAVAEQTAIAIFLSSVALFIIYSLVGNKVNNILSIANVTAFESNEKEKERKVTKYDSDKKQLKNYPLWGEQWGRIIIPSINRNLPIFEGDSLDIIINGPGHHGGSYYPGEGGSIIIAAHNSVKEFYYLPQVKVGDAITIKTDYGSFDYNVYKTDIINEKEGNKVPIHNDYEELILYTCYPVGGIGYKSQRFVVYAKLSLVEGSN